MFIKTKIQGFHIHTMKVYGEVEVWLQSLITLPLDGDVRSTSRSGHFKAEKDPLHVLNRGVGWPWRKFGRFGEGIYIMSLPGFEIHIIQPETYSPY